MNNPELPESHPASANRRIHWPSLIWSVPLAALLIVGYLGIDALAHRGEVVTVTFRRAADARAGDTKVIYQGVETGHLIKIVPNKDGRRLDFQLRLAPEAKQGLNSNARFWLIGATPNLTDLSSLKAVVAGVAIGYAPGEGGTPTRQFEGLDRAPIVLPGDKGSLYWLRAHSLGSIREGSSLLFHGQSIGRITEVQFRGKDGFRLGAFVFRPYDVLVKPGARFWKISPLRLSLAGGGVNANLAPASTLLAGGVDLEVDPATADAAQSPADAEFTLYSSRNAAREGLSGPTVRYEVAFDVPAGDLDEDSPVTLLGFQIGEVESARLAYDPRSGAPYTIATAALYPHRLLVADSVDAADLRRAMDTKVRELIRSGYRARLQQSPPLIGNDGIALVKIDGAVRASLSMTDTPRIPSAPGSSGVGDILTHTDQLLTKMNQIPLQQIGESLRQVTAGINRLISSPETAASLQHLNNTLAEVDHLLSDVQPKVGPLLDKLNQAALDISGSAGAARQLLDGGGSSDNGSLTDTLRDLDDAALSIRTLTDYLNRHPEALIRGKRPEK